MRVITKEKVQRRLKEQIGESVNVLDKKQKTILSNGMLSFDDRRETYFVDSVDDSLFFCVDEVYNTFFDELEKSFYIVLDE